MKREAIYNFLTHVLAALLLFLVPALTLANFSLVTALLGIPFGAMALSAFSLAYVPCACVLLWRKQRIGRPSLYETAAITGAVLFAVLITLLALRNTEFDPDLPRRWVFSGVLLFTLFAMSLIWWHQLVRVKFVALLVVTLISVVFLVRAEERSRAPPTPTVGVYFVQSSLYKLRVTRYKNWYPRPFASGGGLSDFGARKLLVTGDGDMYVFEQTRDRRVLDVKRLSLRVPLNSREFRRDVSARVNATWFRVADILVTHVGDQLTLYASHHYWMRDRRCTVVRISSVSGEEGQFLHAGGRLAWKTVYETPQCLPLDTGDGEYFAGLQVGGRMAIARDGRLLLTLGDHEFDGWTRRPAVSSDPKSPYGKIIAIRLDDLRATTYCSGLRNPQGLFIDAEGSIWETEHGPQGGDEFNHILEGRNYGWPYATYGTAYGLTYWPLSRRQGSQAGYEKPIFSWVPSVGVSNLVQVDGGEFPLWRGDFLVGTLKAKSLIRVRVRDGRVVLAAPIFVNAPIRDIMLDDDGRVIIWADDDLLFIDLAEVDPAPEAFGRCGTCHSAEAASTGGVAPNLYGIVDRRVASRRDWEYSPAMRGLGGRWTTARLDQFIANPGGMVPGTTMNVEGITNANERHKLIEYLQTLR